jgi:metal-responsive CopG/Arc/MetJ family transcriptional regulator
MQQKKEAFIGVRLTKDEVKKLDQLSQGQLNRSQVVRLLIREFLAMPEDQQRQIIFRRLFDK